jgi:hypothetical protein
VEWLGGIEDMKTRTCETQMKLFQGHLAYDDISHFPSSRFCDKIRTFAAAFESRTEGFLPIHGVGTPILGPWTKCNIFPLEIIVCFG